MVNGDGAQQSTVIERLLIRLEVEVSALNQRMMDNNNLLLEAIRQTNERMTDNNNLLLEAIRQTNERITETNQRMTDNNNLLLEAIRQTNQRIDATNQRIDATNTRLDNQVGELRREFRSEFNKLTYLILGMGAAIIAAVAATQLFA